MADETPQIPADEQQPGGQSRIGVDDWVASVEERRERRTALRRTFERIPPPAKLIVPVAAVALFPLLTDSDYLVRVGFNTIYFALLALGLNVAVGYAGLLDLGYVAFFGFGAYTYAVLSSSQFDIHLPTAVALPIVVVASALLGLLLGLPSRRLLAFAFGASIAGLTGSLFAAQQEGVFPGNFELFLLIMIYAMVILGGAGSLAGVVIGATLISVLTEVLEQPREARLLFYSFILLGLLAAVRAWGRIAAILGGTVVFGFVCHALVEAVWERGTAGSVTEGGRFAGALEAWVVLPSDPKNIANAAFVALVVSVIVLTRLRGRLRLVALVPVLYLAAFVWENRLVTEPSVTRNLLLGATLIALMTVRPQGLLGTAKVEIV